jgi:hypothetical protein
MEEDRYEQAKKHLRKLRDEHSDLPNSLQWAVKECNSEETNRLRSRQAELPGELLETELEVCSLQVARLRAEQSQAQQEHERAKLRSKEADLRVGEELKELDAKRKELTDERFARLAEAYRLNESIQRRWVEIDRAEQELKAKLELAVKPIV